MRDSNQTPRQERPNTWVWGFLLVAWACILLMAYSLGLHERFLTEDKPPAATANVSTQANIDATESSVDTPVAPACDLMPPPAGKLLVQTTGRNPSTPQRASMDIDNQHFFPVLLRFTNISAGGLAKVVYVDKQTRDRMQVPAGNYRLLVEVGEDWCSIAEGFNNGHTLRYQESVTISDGAVSVLRFVPMGVEPKDMMVSFTSGGLEGQAATGKTLELSRQMDGHFHVAAQVNNHPVTFMVDTGATTTTIPYQAAKEMGLDRKCKPAKFNTAAGAVNGCTTVIDELRFGNFTLRQIEVAFNQANNMPLLGMNVLSQFRMQQLGNTLLISN